MARRKIHLADGIARVVYIETDATKGATLGTNLYLPDGSVATPTNLAAYLGVSGSSGGSSATQHSQLQGLSGNDHPQYALVSALADVAFDGAYGSLSGTPTIITTLADLSDVDVTPGPAVDGYSLTYDDASGKFVLASVSGGGSISLDDLSDVDAVGPSDGDVLTYDSYTGTWVPAAPSGGSGGAIAQYNPEIKPATPNTCDDEFDYGTSLDTSGARFSGAAAWAVVATSGCTETVEHGCLKHYYTTNSGSRRIHMPYTPSSAWEVVTRTRRLNGEANYGLVGFGLEDASNGYRVEAEWKYTGGRKLEISRYNSGYSALYTSGAFDTVLFNTTWLWLRFYGDSSNYNIDYSYDGVLWVSALASRSIATDFTNGIGYISTESASPGSGVSASNPFMVAWDLVRVRS